MKKATRSTFVRAARERKLDAIEAHRLEAWHRFEEARSELALAESRTARAVEATLRPSRSRSACERRDSVTEAAKASASARRRVAYWSREEERRAMVRAR